MSAKREVRSDLSAERIVLSGLLNYGYDAYVDVCDIVDANCFMDIGNQIIFKCVDRFFAEEPGGEIDLASLIATGRRLGFDSFFDKKQEIQHLKALQDTQVSLSNVGKFAGVIKKLQITRQLQQKLLHVANDLLPSVDGHESITDILAQAEDTVFDFSAGLRETESNDPENFGEGISDYVEFLAQNKRTLLGIPTGYPRFDAAIGGGCRRKTITMIGARPKKGKSILANNIASYTADQNIPVLYLDTEMAKEDQWVRYLASKSNIGISEIERGLYAEDHISLDAIKTIAHDSESLPIYYLNVSGLDLNDTLSVVRRWVMKEVGFDENDVTNDCLIILDYLKLTSEKGLNSSVQEYQKLGFMMTSMHNFAVKYDVPILSFLQLNRDGINQENEAVAGGSDRIIHLCSSFTIYKGKTPEEIAEDGPTEGNFKFVPIVSRHGPGVEFGDYINLFREGRYSRITEGRTHLEIQIDNQTKTDQENIEVD